MGSFSIFEEGGQMKSEKTKSGPRRKAVDNGIDRFIQTHYYSRLSVEKRV
jgi:hypothetical protein